MPCQLYLTHLFCILRLLLRGILSSPGSTCFQLLTWSSSLTVWLLRCFETTSRQELKLCWFMFDLLVKTSVVIYLVRKVRKSPKDTEQELDHNNHLPGTPTITTENLAGFPSWTTTGLMGWTISGGLKPSVLILDPCCCDLATENDRPARLIVISRRIDKNVSLKAWQISRIKVAAAQHIAYC